MDSTVSITMMYHTHESSCIELYSLGILAGTHNP